MPLENGWERQDQPSCFPSQSTGLCPWIFIRSYFIILRQDKWPWPPTLVHLSELRVQWKQRWGKCWGHMSAPKHRRVAKLFIHKSTKTKEKSVLYLIKSKSFESQVSQSKLCPFLLPVKYLYPFIKWSATWNNETLNVSKIIQIPCNHWIIKTVP